MSARSTLLLEHHLKELKKTQCVAPITRTTCCVS